MTGYQCVIVTGHLLDDPTYAVAPGGGGVATLRIAVAQVWQDRATGERLQHTERLRIKAFDKLTDALAPRRQGHLVTIQGVLHTEAEVGADGAERATTWIYADTARYHPDDGHAHTRRDHRGRSTGAQPPESSSSAATLDDDFPF